MLLFVSIASFSQETWDMKVTRNYVNFRNSLYGIMNDFENDFGIDLDYSSDDLPNQDIGPINFNGMTLNGAISKLLRPYGLHFKLMGSNTVVIRKSLSEIDRMLEPTRFGFTLEGVITEAETGESLPFASIGVKDRPIGTTSNVDGYFTLPNTPTDTSTLVFKYLGYKTKAVKLFPGMVDKGKVEFTLAPVSTQLEEVIVSDKKEHMMKATEKVSMISVSPQQLSGLPSLGEKDIFRSMQLLPGISATNETSSGLYVRGGTPDQNLVVFDGFNVYHVDHFYGFFSAFNANAIKSVQMYKGGFEAKYGGRTSSVVELTGRDGNEERTAGSFGLSLLSMNGTFETPFADKKGTAFVGFRRSYTDIIRSGLYQNIFGQIQEENESNTNTGFGPGGGRFAQLQNEPSFYFYDLNAKVAYRPSENDNLEYSFYSGKDKLDNSNDFNSSDFGGFFGDFDAPSFNNETTDLTDWGNVGTSFKWSRQWNNKLFSNNIISYSNYFSNRDRFSNTRVSNEDSTFNVRTGTLENNDVNELNFKSQWEYELNSNHNIGFGTEIVNSQIDYLLVEDDTTTILDINDHGVVSSFYLQDEWRPNEKLTVIPGIRVSHYTGTNQIYYEPRLSASYRLTDRIKIKAATGKFNQYVTRVAREDVSQGNRDFWLLADGELNPVSSAVHYIAGLSYETDDYLFDIEAYRKNHTGLSEYTLRLSTDIRNRTTDVSELFYQGNGYSQGIEFLVQKKFGKHTGWISYTLSQTIYDFPDLSASLYPALHDQTHEFKLIENLRVKNWTFGGAWIFATGKPYTEPLGSYELTLLDGSTETYISVGDKNGRRLPNYHRLDLSASHDFHWGDSQAQIGLSIFNVYNNTNVWYKTYDFIEEDLIETDVTTLGFTPNLFFNIKF